MSDDNMFRQKTPQEILEDVEVGMRSMGYHESVIAAALKGPRYGKYIVMRRDMTMHSRHLTMDAATAVMRQLNESGIFLKLEA